ncbi:MAG: PAS domain S-box protein [Pyrinomonadaceae bacterium]
MKRNSFLWIVAGAIAAIVLLMANVLLNFSNVRALTQDANLVDHTYRVIGGLDNVLSLVKDAERGQRGFIVTGESRYLEPYNTAVKAIDAKVNEVEQLTADSPAQQARFPELRRRIGLRLEILGGNLSLRQTDGFDAARAGIMTGRGENAMVGVSSHIAEMVAYEQERLRERSAKHDQAYRTTVYTGLLSGLLTLIAIGAFLLMLRSYLRSRSRAATIIADQGERLRITLASIGDAVISTDKDGRVNYLNGVAESLTGWSNAAAAGEPLETVFKIINETTRETVENPAVKALREGVIVGLANHTILISRNGAEWPIDDSAAPIRDEQGAISGVVLIFREITQRKLAENQLRRAHQDLEIKVAERTAELAHTNQFLNALLENLQEGIVACDADGVLTLFNRATRELHGLPEAKIPAEQWADHYDLFHPDGVTRMSKDEIPLFRALAGEPVKAAEMVIAPKNGEPRHLLASGQQFRNDDGKVLGAVVSMHDITRRKHAEEALRTAHDNLEMRVAERTAELAASEERSTNIVSSIADGLITLDHEWRVTYINSRGDEILRPLRLTDSSARGKNFWEEFPATIGTIIEENYRRAVREQVMVQFETFYTPLECWFDIRAYPSRDGLSLYFLDITARKQAEADQAERNRLISLRADISAGLASENSLQIVLQGAAEAFVQYLDMAFARIWIHNAQQDVLELEASAGLYTHLDGPHSRVKVGEFKIGRIAESREPHLTNAVARDPNVSDPKWAEKEGMVAFAGYPLLVENRMVGVLAMFSRNQVSESVLTELAPLADAIAQFIDRKRSDSAMRESEVRKTAMFEAALDCIISMDQEGRIIEFNAAAEKTFGHRREDVLGLDLADVIIPPAFREGHRKGIEHYFKTGEGPALNRRLELSALRADGSEFPVELTVTRIPVDGDAQFTAYLRDITESKQLKDLQEKATLELRQLAANLSQADHRKNEFLAMLAHELRNPLAPISNALQIMRLTDDGTATAATDMMERQVGQLVRLVDDLLDVSRITQGKIQLRRERIELASVVHHAVEAAKPSCESGGVDLRLALESQPIYLNGDQTRLAQVIGNLLNNSCKFTDKGGSIDLIVERDGGDAVIRVIDTGIGIAPGQLGHVFELFVQADTSLERSISGLGIGLTLVKNLVEMHGGKIEAKSEGLGRGSEFTVRLPVLEKTEMTSLAPVMTTIEKAGEGRKILVVDDNMDSAESLSMLLQMKGNEVCMAHDGREAVETAAGFLPQVILLDIGLPVLNGYEAAREIRQQPWGKNMILIALTGWGQDEDRQRSKDAGFDSHMVKPVDHVALMKRLDELSGSEAEPPA